MTWSQCVLLLVTLTTQGQSVRLPTFDEVVAGLAAAEARLENLSVRTEYDKVDAFTNNPPLQLKMTANATVDNEGRLTYVVKGEQGAGGGKKYQGTWRGAYDGQAFHSLDGNADGQFSYGRIDDHWSMHGINPLEFTTRYFQRSIAQELKDKGGRVVERVMLGGRPVVLIEQPPIQTSESRKVQFWVEPERWVVVKRAITRKPEGRPWREYTRLETSDYVEVKPGVWLPGKVKQESLEWDAKTGKETISWSYAGTNHDWKVNQPLPADAFDLKFPANVRVTDGRKRKP